MTPIGLDMKPGLPKLYSDLIAEKTKLLTQKYLLTESELTGNHFAEILDTCFFSSLLKEEERSLCFNIAIISKEQCKEMSYQTVEFETPVPFIPELIKKLALISNNQAIHLCVWKKENDFQAWGLLLVKSLLTATSYPLCPVVKIHGPGKLQVLFCSDYLLYYSPERFYLEPQKQWTQRLLTVLSHVRIEPDIMLQVLSCITNSVVRQGHGGALLLSNRSTDEFKSILTGGHDVKPRNPDKIHAFIREFSEFELAHPLSAPHEKLIAQSKAAQYLALFQTTGMFSAIDGAIALNSDLEYFGFGKMIVMSESDLQNETSIARVDPYTNKVEEYVRISEYPGGTRHRSALAFCRKITSSLAIVVSQDTMISVFFSPMENTVVALTPFLPFEPVFKEDYGTGVIAAHM